MQAFDEDSDDKPGPNVAFFKEWAALLNWEDHDMIRQLTLTGAESRSAMQWDTVIHAHHTDTRQFFAIADEAVEKDTAAGWIERGRLDLWMVPARLTPKNVVKQLKWRLDRQGNLTHKEKRRLTSDGQTHATTVSTRKNGGTFLFQAFLIWMKLLL